MAISYASILVVLFVLIPMGGVIYLLVLAAKALRRYIRADRKENTQMRKSLGETIKLYRTERKMTQEFVAESLGVSRQAVSKWESGVSDPSTSNLFALAKLFGVSVEELLPRME